MSKSFDAAISSLSKLSAHPAAFGVGVGIANGLLAEGRNIPLTLKSAAITAVVVGLGEAALASEISDRKHSLLEIGLWSVAGLGVGLFPFVALQGEKSYVQMILNRPALTVA